MMKTLLAIGVAWGQLKAASR